MERQTDLEEFVPPGSLNSNPMPRTKRSAPKAGSDFYPTPAWVTSALVSVEPFEGEIWEPACGLGDMSDALILGGHAVYSSDLHNRGYGVGEHDFLQSTRKSINIVTNPPFKIADDFVAKACRLASGKVAMFLPLPFLSGVDRQKNLFSKYKPNRVWIFSERPTLYKYGAEEKGSGVTTYAWFIWDRKSPCLDYPQIRWLPIGLKPRKQRIKKSTKKETIQ